MKANKVVKHIKEEPEECVTFRSDAVAWPSQPGEQLQVCTASVSDASHGQEEEYLPEEHIREAFRSQGAKLNFLASTESKKRQECT